MDNFSASYKNGDNETLNNLVDSSKDELKEQYNYLNRIKKKSKKGFRTISYLKLCL